MEVGSTHVESTLNFELTCPLISSMCVYLQRALQTTEGRSNLIDSTEKGHPVA